MLFLTETLSLLIFLINNANQQLKQIHNGIVMNQMLSNTILILLLPGGGVPEGGGGR